MSNNQKFNEAKERLINSAQRVAGAYMLSKYGSAHFSGEPKVELTATEGPTSSSFVFSGSITCFAGDGLLNQVGVNMTINENDIEVTSEDIQANISDALNAAEDQAEHVVASLDGFKLQDDGTIYLKVSHKAVQSPVLGIVGKNEYATSKDRASLLQGILKDAFLETPITFEGEFKEPVIEKVAIEKQASKHVEARPNVCRNCYDANCFACEGTKDGGPCECGGCNGKGGSKKEKKSWLTAGFDAIPEMSDPELDDASMYQDHVKCNNCEWDGMVGRHSESCPNCGTDGALMDIEQDVEAATPTLGIREDMPMARATDHLAQMEQLEEQLISASSEKIKNEAANALISMLHGMGYGTAKIAEVTSSKDGLDFMAAIDDGGSVKAVSIPVVIKEAKVVLPKKSLVSTLISKGLDVRAKLAEQFDLDVLEKLAAIDEKMAYETKEANDILADRPAAAVVKEAAGQKQPFWDSDDSTLTLQKHLLPDHESLKLNDTISDGTDSWKIVNMEGQQNSRGEGDSSLWTLKKCQAPEAPDAKEEKKEKKIDN